jgi:uncharacterized protein
VLTVEHARVRRKGDELVLDVTGGAKPERALELATRILEIAQAASGLSRGEFAERLSDVVVEPREEKLKLGFIKLLEGLATEDEIDNQALEARRKCVFEAAAVARKAGSFDREAILAACASTLAVESTQLAAELYADLDQRRMLRFIQLPSAAALYESYMREVQIAPLLRADKVVLTLKTPAPEQFRRVVSSLKFHGLLAACERTESDITCTIDGPMSLFGSSTKYGMDLALTVRSIGDDIDWTLEANVRHSGQRNLVYHTCSVRHAANNAPARRKPKTAATPTAAGDAAQAQEHRRPEVATLIAGLKKLENVGVDEAAEIVFLGDAGLIASDFTVQLGKRRCLVEVMGYWSRDAVWRRVENAGRAGTPPIVFCVSERLRVSEAVLAEQPGAALYVYKGTPRPAALLRAIEGVVRNS